MSHCLCLALPSFPFSLDLHACPQQLINQTRLGPSFARSCIISSDKDYPGISVLAQANGQVIELHDLSAGHILCKEQLENKKPRQKQVLEYEGGSGTEGLKVAWKLCLGGLRSIPSLQLSHSIDTRLLAFESRQHLSSEKQELLVAFPCAFIAHVCKSPQPVRKSLPHS